MESIKYSVDKDLNYKAFFKNFSSESNLYIYGKPGVGKTSFANHIYNLEISKRKEATYKLQEIDEKLSILYKERSEYIVENKIEAFSYFEWKDTYPEKCANLESEDAIKVWSEYHENQLNFPINNEIQDLFKDKEKLKKEILNYTIPMVVNMNDFIKTIQKTWDKDCPYDVKKKLRTTVNEMNSAKVLIIDDLGVENASDGIMPYIYELFESRYENRNVVQTIITSNFDISALEEKYKRKKDKIQSIAVERLISRIDGLVEKYFMFDGLNKRNPDNRKILNIENIQEVKTR